MERRITRHATRLSQAHQGALDTAFRQGQRVRTADGFLGRILFVTEAFSPGAEAYEVQLDDGSGGGTYLASQLRPVPESFGGGHQAPAYLPAGVTAALEAEADLDAHTADLDYPEMGSVLTDRPDPGRVITLIGSRTAAQYADGYDPRENAYNGEPEVGGIYWQAPAQQQFVQEEGLDRPEEPVMQPEPLMTQASIPDWMEHGIRSDPSLSSHDREFIDHVFDHIRRGAPASEPIDAEDAMMMARGHRTRDRMEDAGYELHPESKTTRYPRGFNLLHPAPGHDSSHHLTHTLTLSPNFPSGWHVRVSLRDHPLVPHIHHDLDAMDDELPGELHKYLNHPQIAPAMAEQRAQALNHTATVINGEQIDDHGDAPEHGTRPRASEPNAYDDESTEGQGDDKWDDPVDAEDKKEFNGATIGMYPEGVSAGGGPGIGVGAFTAAKVRKTHVIHDPEGMRPNEYKDYEEDLEGPFYHGSQSGSGATEGDFVPSYEFTNKYPEYVSEPDPAAGITAEAVGEHYEPYQHLPPDFWQREHVPDADFGELSPYEGAEEDVASPDQHEGTERRYRMMHTLSGLGPHRGGRHSMPEETPAGRHLMHGHGWSDDDIHRAVNRGNDLSALHGHMHEDPAGSNHVHTGDPRHEEALTHRFGPEASPVDPRRTDPRRGGTPFADPAKAILDAAPQDWGGLHERMPLHKLNSAAPEVIGPRAFTEHIASGAITETVYKQLSDDYPPAAIEWVRHARWSGPHFVPFDHVDWDSRKRWSSYHQPERVEGFVRKGIRKAKKGKTLNPSILIEVPGQDRQRIGDGHHRALSCLIRAVTGENAPPGVWAWTASVGSDTGPWDEMHAAQYHDDSERKGADDTGTVGGSDGTPEERTQFQQQVEEGVRRFGDAETSDDSAGSLNADKTGRSPGYVSPNPDKSSQKKTRTSPRAGIPPVPSAASRPPMSEGGTPSKKHVRAALRALEQSAGDAAFRFEFTASWRDVQAKAKRMRAEGKVRIVMARNSLVIGEVEGDHATYESGIQTYPGRPGSVMAYICGCPWATFHQNEEKGFSRFAGRMCSHALAIRYEASSRGMFGRPLAENEHEPGWLPHKVVVYSEPPFADGHWTTERFAPAASKTAAADSPWMRPSWSEEELGDHLYHQHGWSRDKVTHVTGKERWRQHVQEHQFGEIPAAARGQERAVAHQHDFPQEAAGEQHWPDVFQLSEHTDFAGGGPSKHHWDNIMRGQSAPLRPLPPHMSRFMTVDEARELCRQDPVYQAARILLGHGEETRQVAALMSLAGADPDALIRRHLDVAHTEGLGRRQYPGGMDARQYHELLHQKGAAAIMPHRHEMRQPPADAGAPDLHAVEAVLIMQADQANAPWGAGAEHVDSPAKPYGATSPPEKDRDPGSYGPLAGPDPDNWGEIQDGSFIQMPLGNTAATMTADPVRVHEHRAPDLSHDGPDLPPEQDGGGDDGSGKNHFTVIRNRPAHFGIVNNAENEEDAYVGYENSFQDAVHHIAHLKAEGHFEPSSVRYAPKTDAKRTTDITPEFHNHYARWFEPGSPGYRPHSDPAPSAGDMSPEQFAEHVRGWHPGVRAKDHYSMVKSHAEEHTHNLGASFARGNRADACPSAWNRWTQDTAQNCGYRGPSGHEHAPSMRELFGGHDISGLYEEGGEGPSKLSALVNKQVEGPDMLDWIPEHQESFPYSDQANTSGPVTSISPRDPQGLRMEESLGEPEQPGGAMAELKDEPEGALDPEGLTADQAWAEHVARTYTRMAGYNAAHDPSIMSAMQQGGAQHPDENLTQNPGMGSWDEPSVPDDQSIQTTGQQQWSGGGSDSDEGTIEPGQPRDEGLDEIVAAFQRSAAATQYGGGAAPGTAGMAAGDGDIAAAARAFLSKTADALPPDEADELIREGRGTRARNLDMLDLRGTHYDDDPGLDDHDDDVIYA